MLLLVMVGALALTACSDDDSADGESLTLNETTLQFTGYSTSQIIEVDATRQWAAESTVDWITITPDQYPGNDHHFTARVGVLVANNTTGQPRTGTVVFYINETQMATLTVNQDKQDESDKPVETSPITWANLQWQAAEQIAVNTQFEAGTCVFVNGLTNVGEASTDGVPVYVQIGYSKNNSAPTGDDWTWQDCWFNGDWGDNWYYQGKTPEISEPGTYYYTFRCQYEDGVYVYSGTNGLWDGKDNALGTFEVIKPEKTEFDYDNAAVAFCNIQWTASNEINAGEQLEAGSKLKIDGLTNAMQAAVAGDDNIVCQIGYGTSADPKGSDWKWADCWWNGDWGDEWYYQGKTEAIATAGTYYYAFRYKIGKQDYIYVGTNGVWDGKDNVCGTVTVK